MLLLVSESFFYTFLASFFGNDIFHFVLQYEPELFPGLIYRMKQPKIVLLIFVSGKIVLTGAKVNNNFLYMLNVLPFPCLFPAFNTLSTGERGDVYSL